MNNEDRPQQVPANADGNLRETHDDESALRSDWGSDESICESLGGGRPRDDPNEPQGELQAQDDPDQPLFNESGAQSAHSGFSQNMNEVQICLALICCPRIGVSHVVCRLRALYGRF